MSHLNMSMLLQLHEFMLGPWFHSFVHFAIWIGITQCLMKEEAGMILQHNCFSKCAWVLSMKTTVAPRVEHSKNDWLKSVNTMCIVVLLDCWWEEHGKKLWQFSQLSWHTILARVCIERKQKYSTTMLTSNQQYFQARSVKSLVLQNDDVRKRKHF